VPVLELLERLGPERRRRARIELEGLGHGPARQLGSADAGREPKIVFDPPRRTRLPAERRALDNERVQTLGSTVDGRSEAGRAGADARHMDLVARSDPAADSAARRARAG